MKSRIPFRLAFLSALFLSLACATATIGAATHALTLAPVFTDHMLLQRDQPIAVFGRAEPGATVTVAFAGATASVTADAASRWLATLPAQPASDEPRTLTATAGDVSTGGTVTIRDILVGELWLAAGQSNMQWTLAQEAHAAEETPRAGHPAIRLRDHARPWAATTPKTAPAFSAIACYFARDLHAALGVPVGVINIAVGGTPAEAWVSRDTLAADPDLRTMVAGNWLDNPALDDWCKRRARRDLGLAALTTPNPGHSFAPGHHFDAAIAPLIPLVFRGVIWYQGESNSLSPWRVPQHEKLLPLLVRDWRARWGRDDFPFLFCQISGIEPAHYAGAENWPAFRDSQRRLAKIIPNSGSVVTHDHGNPRDVHPREKRAIAARLTCLALAQTYGHDLLPGGPEPLAAASAPDGTLRVTFAHAGAGLRTSDGAAPRGFEIAGVAGDFHPATATLDGDSVLLTATAVASPCQVRYAWKPFPDANLVNNKSLPAPTFLFSAPSTQTNHGLHR